MKISEAKFRITQKQKNLSQTVTITGNAKTSQGKTFVFEDERARVDGSYVLTSAMLANGHLAQKRTPFFNPMTIDWRVKYKKDGIPKTKYLGSSKHTVYVTLKKPLRKFAKLYLTPLHLATSNSGARDKVQALEKTWELFETKQITNWDSKPLYYYKSGHGFKDLACDDLSALLSMGKGQCDTFEKLFRATLSANGNSSYLVVYLAR